MPASQIEMVSLRRSVSPLDVLDFITCITGVGGGRRLKYWLLPYQLANTCIGCWSLYVNLNNFLAILDKRQPQIVYAVYRLAESLASIFIVINFALNERYKLLNKIRRYPTSMPIVLSIVALINILALPIKKCLFLNQDYLDIFFVIHNRMPCIIIESYYYILSYSLHREIQKFRVDTRDLLHSKSFSSPTPSKADLLAPARLQYQRIVSAVESLNSGFRAELTFCCFSIGFQLVIGAFSVSRLVQTFADSSDQGFIMGKTLVRSTEVLRFWTICRSSSWLNDSNEELELSLSMESVSTSKMAKSDRIINKIEFLRRQCKASDLKLSLFNFSTIDMSSFLAVLGTAILYGMILSQFDLKDDLFQKPSDLFSVENVG